MADIVQLKTAEEIRDDILAALAGELAITDAELGSAIRTLTFAFASELDELFYQLWRATKGFYIRTSTGYALTQRAIDYGLTRNPSVKSVGHVTFSGTNGTSIPLGTQVAVPATQYSDEIVFETTAVGSISGGSVQLPIQALVAGTAGNTGVGTITFLKTSVSGVASVSNANATLLGEAEESDEELRARILRTLAGLSRGTPPSIHAGAIDFEIQEVTLAGDVSNSATTIPVYEDLNLHPIATSGVIRIENEAVLYTGISLSRDPDAATWHSFTGCTRGHLSTSAVAHSAGVAVKEWVTAGKPETVDSAFLVEIPSSSHVDVYVADGTTTAADSTLVALVQNRLRGDGTTRNGGYRGAGITLDVIAATITTITVTSTFTILSGYTAATIQALVKTAIQNYVNALGVGENVLAYRIAEATLSVEGVSNITALTVNAVTFDGTSAADVTISASAVARTGSANITLTT